MALCTVLFIYQMLTHPVINIQHLRRRWLCMKDLTKSSDRNDMFVIESVSSQNQKPIKILAP